MRFEEVTYSDGYLHIKASGYDVRKFVYGFKSGEYEIKKAPKKRSLDSNSYAWVLIDKIAEAVKLPKTEVYRSAIKEIGGVSDVVCVQNEAVEKLCSSWQKNGLGFQTETMPSKIQGCTNVVLYYGSSTYTTQQMSALINVLVEDARSLGIETMTPRELARLVSLWESEE